MANVTVNGITYTVEAGTKLGDLLAREQHMSMPCGGHGRCGKCRVAAAGELSDYSDRERDFLSEKEFREGVRLACCAVVEGDCTVQLAGTNAGHHIETCVFCLWIRAGYRHHHIGCPPV